MRGMSYKVLLQRLALGVLFLFAVYSNIQKVIHNYQLRKQIDDTQAEVDQMKSRNEKLSLLLSYYQSPSYQEVEARRRLGVKKPEETAYIVKGGAVPTTDQDNLETTIYKEAVPTTVPQKSNISQWIDYFAGRR